MSHVEAQQHRRQNAPLTGTAINALRARLLGNDFDQMMRAADRQDWSTEESSLYFKTNKPTIRDAYAAAVNVALYGDSAYDLTLGKGQKRHGNVPENFVGLEEALKESGMIFLGNLRKRLPQMDNDDVQHLHELFNDKIVRVLEQTRQQLSAGEPVRFR